MKRREETAMPHEHDFGRGAPAVVRSPAPDLAVTVRTAPSTHSKAVGYTASTAAPASMTDSAQRQFLHTPLQTSDLREVPFLERGKMTDNDLETLIEHDVPGSFTEHALREQLKKYPQIKRENVKPHCAP